MKRTTYIMRKREILRNHNYDAILPRRRGRRPADALHYGRAHLDLCQSGQREAIMTGEEAGVLAACIVFCDEHGLYCLTELCALVAKERAHARQEGRDETA